MSAQGYSTAELLALRSAPLSPHPHASPAPQSPRRSAALPEVEYQAFHRAVIANHEATFAFAHYTANPLLRHLVVPPPPARIQMGERCPGGVPTAVQWAEGVAVRGVFGEGSGMAKWLRYGRSVACFNLYPACRRDLLVNDLLWRVAQAGEYYPEEGNLLLESNVLSLAMPHKFFAFLAGISQEDLKTCMLQVLALIAEDEDAEGLALMKLELEDSVWEDLEKYMCAAESDTPCINSSTEQGLKLMRDVEMLLRLCYLSPWKIDVYSAYVTPQDMSTMLAESQRFSGNLADAAFPAHDVSDRRLVRSGARRPLAFTSPTMHHEKSPPRRRRKSKTLVFWKLFQDWRRYRRILVEGLGISPSEVTGTMLHSIGHGTQQAAWDRAELVMASSCVRGNLFSSLPRDVVFNNLAAHILLAGSNA